MHHLFKKFSLLTLFLIWTSLSGQCSENSVDTDQESGRPKPVTLSIVPTNPVDTDFLSDSCYQPILPKEMWGKIIKDEMQNFPSFMLLNKECFAFFKDEIRAIAWVYKAIKSDYPLIRDCFRIKNIRTYFNDNEAKIDFEKLGHFHRLAFHRAFRTLAFDIFPNSLKSKEDLAIYDQAVHEPVYSLLKNFMTPTEWLYFPDDIKEAYPESFKKSPSAQYDRFNWLEVFKLAYAQDQIDPKFLIDLYKFVKPLQEKNNTPQLHKELKFSLQQFKDIFFPKYSEKYNRKCDPLTHEIKENSLTYELKINCLHLLTYICLKENRYHILNENVYINSFYNPNHIPVNFNTIDSDIKHLLDVKGPIISTLLQLAKERFDIVNKLEWLARLG